MNVQPPASSANQSTNEILRYQEHRGLDDCPGFLASAQFNAGPAAGPLVVALRADGLEIYTGNDSQFLYDLEGRPIRFSTPHEYRFRGTSHQGSVARKIPREHGGGMERVRLDAGDLNDSCREAWTIASDACHALEGGTRPQWAQPDHHAFRAKILPLLQKIEAFTPERLAAEADRFAQVYQPVPILPPDHYASLVLQASEGCSFNTCTFCSLYRGVPFRVRTVEEFEYHLRAALFFHGEGLRRFLHIFLGQANALAIPQARLVALLKCLRRHVELPPADAAPPRAAWAYGHKSRFLGVGSFLDGFTGLNKSAADYAELRALGLVRTYLGVESGSASLLSWLQKPASPNEMLETLRHLKAGGVATDVILLVGVGGSKFAGEHVRDSLDFLKVSPLQRGDRVFLSELIERSDAPYRDRIDAAHLSRLSPEEVGAQKTELVRGIRELGLQAVPYRIEPFIY